MTETITVAQEKSLQIASGFANMAAIAEGIQTQEDAKKAVENLKTLEDLLRSLDEFNKQVVKYVSLEIETYRRINALGLTHCLKRESQRSIAAWVGEQTETELDELILQLKVKPQTLERFFANRIRSKQIIDDAIEDCAAKKKAALAAYKRGETVYLNSLFIVPDHRVSTSVKDMYNSVKATTRSELLKLGAVCGDEGFGVYINPKTAADKQQIQNCLVTRANHIMAELKSFMQLADMADGTCEQDERTRLVFRIAKAFRKELSEQDVAKSWWLQP